MGWVIGTQLFAFGYIGCHMRRVSVTMYRVSQNYPNHADFRDFRHCAETAAVVVSQAFERLTHQESKLTVTLSPSEHIIPFSH